MHPKAVKPIKNLVRFFTDMISLYEQRCMSNDFFTEFWSNPVSQKEYHKLERLAKQFWRFKNTHLRGKHRPSIPVVLPCFKRSNSYSKKSEKVV
jgi:hypothetical protein